ncbi:hypothetical protein SAMN05216185_111171 [Pseudomonas guariconensis]|uniref:DNA-binding protein n=1 Tax=Pseudomonas guariconensis TaxID=1288410 RepID=A0AAX0VUY4_9PSED|nr:hypothetical protein [Pseudomonas guariconensis]PLV17740.1 hypothetical protein CXG49_17240 [Pseudomonas guariconensis]PLV22672.1 hypothetical protein CXG53_19205 [Pseudomonas guariconensis]PLV27695.1 hypothetical protein CXG51_19685 [Pseudomonas guariconensis]SDD78696.1 hypothetical protein SAMN05216185_111171 [Pseudomonas guariconensis]
MAKQQVKPMHEATNQTSEALQLLITPAVWIRKELLFPIFGLSTEAVRKYRDRGIWLEEKQWRTDPANVIVYNRLEIEKWMAGHP